MSLSIVYPDLKIGATGKHEIHISDVRTFKSCRRRWAWSSPLRGHLEPAFTPIHFTIGKAIHFALGTFYETGAHPTDTFVTYLNKEVARQEAELGVLWPDERNKLDEAMRLGKGMLDNYIGWVRSPAKPDDAWESVATEMKFEVQIPNPNTGTPSSRIFLAGRLDAVIRNKVTNQLWLREYKTAAREPNPDWLQLDDQAAIYCWAVEQILGEPVAGIQYRFLMKKVPERPARLKNMSFSKAINSNLSTTYTLYLETLIDEALDRAEVTDPIDRKWYMSVWMGGPDADDIVTLPEHPKFAQFDGYMTELIGQYDDVLTQLNDRGFGEYFKEFPVYKTHSELEAAAHDLWVAGLEMTRPSTPIYTAPEWLKCQFCPFKAPCKVMNAGGNYQTVLDAEYHTRIYETPVDADVKIEG